MGCVRDAGVDSGSSVGGAVARCRHIRADGETWKEEEPHRFLGGPLCACNVPSHKSSASVFLLLRGRAWRAAFHISVASTAQSNLTCTNFLHTPFSPYYLATGSFTLHI